MLETTRNAPLLMGILNVTPDSFSDGGLYHSVDAALRHAELMVSEGADILDIGGESTRPGAEAVEVDQELERVIPVLEAIKSRFDVRLSIDTRKAKVAEEAVKRGATLINDVHGGEDFGMAEVAAKSGAEVILMHMRGTPVTMQVSPLYVKGVVSEVKGYLTARVRAFTELGMPKEKIWVDPGIGFGKTLTHNLELIARMNEFTGIGGRVVVGTSRKSFLAHVVGNPALPFEDRLAGTLASSLYAASQGASVFRVHDVGAMQRALTTWRAIESVRQSRD